MRGGAITKRAVDPSEIDALLKLSGRIGRDPLLAQASSGNTSLKRDGTLWVKASGKWLADADREEILVPVKLAECLDRFRRGDPVPAFDESSWATHLRPSIETFMHAVLPQRVVLHVHSVNTIAWAVRSDAPMQLAMKLFGLPWCWIPYRRSGLPLAREIQICSRRDPRSNIFVLGNHGLVVAADDCAAAEALLFEIERRLATVPRLVPQANFGALEEVLQISGWRLPRDKSIHTLGTDGHSRRIVHGGVLFPCQAVFLGGILPILPRRTSVSGMGKRMASLADSSPSLILERSGVLMSATMSAAQYATLQGYAEVVRRIEVSAPIRYLTNQDVKSLVGAGNHHCRISTHEAMSPSTAQH